MSEARDTLTETGQEKKRHFLLLDLVLRLVKEKPLGTIGAVIVLVMFIVGILAGVLAPYGFNDIHLKDSLTGPSAQYILGTDNLGRDMLSRIIYGAQIAVPRQYSQEPGG